MCFFFVFRLTRGVTMGGKGTTPRAPRHYVGAESLRGAPKSPNNIPSSFFTTVHLLPKIQVRTCGRQACFCPRRHLTLVRVCIWRMSRCKQIKRTYGLAMNFTQISVTNQMTEKRGADHRKILIHAVSICNEVGYSHYHKNARSPYSFFPYFCVWCNILICLVECL